MSLPPYDWTGVRALIARDKAGRAETERRKTMGEIRKDAVVGRHGRALVPDENIHTWVASWDEFRAAGGGMCFNEDQTEIELRLPEGCKFSIKFQRP